MASLAQKDISKKEGVVQSLEPEAYFEARFDHLLIKGENVFHGWRITLYHRHDLGALLHGWSLFEYLLKILFATSMSAATIPKGIYLNFMI